MARQVGPTRSGDDCFGCVDMLGCTTKYYHYCIWCFVIIFFGILYYKNVSFVIVKRLLREPNVVIILVFGLCNWMIDSCAIRSFIIVATGSIYMLIVTTFVFIDAVKSRVFVIVVDFLIFGTINEIYDRTFAGWDQGVVLFKYTMQGKEYTFMKRSVKRSIFLQVMFGMNGIYTI